jgi:hypothetical protein
LKPLPETENPLVIRADFSDDAAWKALCAAIEQPVGQFRAFVEFLDDPAYEGLTAEQVLARVPENFNHGFVFIVDQTALTHPEHPILVVDLFDEPGRAFRLIPSEMWAVENNLSIANMDFAEFANEVDEDGILRGPRRN